MRLERDPLDSWRAGDPAPAPVLARALELAAAGVSDGALAAATLDILQSLGCDSDTLAAALCYERAGVAPAAWDAVAEQWPEGVRRLVEGQRAAEQVWTLHAQRGARGGAEGLRRLLLAIIRDLRVVFVLLARQLARMRAAAGRPESERRALAELSADIHAPLANRLGIWQLKWELEDLAFRFLQPDTYRRIAALLDERRDDREHYIAQCARLLAAALGEAGIRAELTGRPKHIYSIWKKMQRKGVGFSDLYDVRALRVLVDDVPACYAALGVVHQLWPHVPGEFDDYIARPKGNDYRSLHTAVTGPEDKSFEVQIRTREMHRAAELGVAAHWRYKEGGGADAAFESKVAWMRRLLEARGEGEDDAALLAGFRTDLLEDRVYVLTPRGEVIDLPRGATVLDFAYHIHTEVGHRCRGAKRNGRIVPLTFQPASGDRVEILTGKVAEPSRDWLSPHHAFLATARAREKVRAWFRRVEHDANLAAGRALFERELRRLALPTADVERLVQQLGLKSVDELHEALALGEIGSGQLARALHEPVAAGVRPVAVPVRPPRSDPGALTIDGVGNLLMVLARCCQPLPGDAVAGFVTRGRGVSVHRVDCRSLARLAARSPERVIPVQWGRAPAQAYEADIGVRGYDRKDLIKDVTGLITHAGAHIVTSSTRAAEGGEVDMRYTLRVRDFEQLATLLARLGALANVFDARRLRAD